MYFTYEQAADIPVGHAAAHVLNIGLGEHCCDSLGGRGHVLAVAKDVLHLLFTSQSISPGQCNDSTSTDARTDGQMNGWTDKQLDRLLSSPTLP